MLLNVYCSVAQSCPTLCDPMDCSMPGFFVLHCLWNLLKFMSIELVISSSHSSSVAPFSSCLQSFLASGSFPVSWLLSGGQSIGASAWASVLPVNIQGWFPLGLTELIFLSKGFSLLLVYLFYLDLIHCFTIIPFALCLFGFVLGHATACGILVPLPGKSLYLFIFMTYILYLILNSLREGT